MRRVGAAALVLLAATAACADDNPPTVERLNAAFAEDTVRGRVVLFGGRTTDGEPEERIRSNETWEFDGTAWTVVATDGPSARTGAAMACDRKRAVCVLFGGITDVGPSDETWEWDGAAWKKRDVSGPPARSYHVMGWDPASERVVLFGTRPADCESGGCQDTWAFDGENWERVASPEQP